ncbi:AMP-binding protein [Lutibacter sp. Hel_I_33_5]|uniref:AMP-binding protein n=1 Tax=Lutibacter sp. Hel_I_33_5 TaxID=1566289 RepID=UPI00351BCBB7
MNQFHKAFKLNNKSFSTVKELLDYSSSVDESTYSFLSEWFNEDDFILVQTSGSTGKPKPIKVKKEFAINSAITTSDYFDLKENTKALLCLSTDYIAGKMMLVRALTLGWQLDIVSPGLNPLEENSTGYDFSAMVPMQLENSLDKLHFIRKLIVGGGVVSRSLKDKIQSTETQIFATYGMTETVTHIAIKKLNHFNVVNSRAIEKSFYQTLPSISIYKDHRNCLVIEAPKVSNEIIFTNDVVQLISDTKFEWLGRFDNVINSGGIKLHSEKIEEKLLSVINQRFFVAGIADEKFGEKLVLCIEKNVTSSSIEKSQVENDIKSLTSLSQYEIPKEIYFVESFIETETKKIQRNKTLDLVV